MNAEDDIAVLDQHRRKVEGHLGTTLSTAPTERFEDPDDGPAGDLVLSEDPDVDLLPGFLQGRMTGDPELRAAVRDLALSISLVMRILSGVVRRSAPAGFVLLLVSALLVLVGAAVGALTITIWLVTR